MDIASSRPKGGPDREARMAGEPESLDINESLERRRHRHWFDRLIMLSDGVFAIAMTLLALELHPPSDWDGRLASLWTALIPQLDAYALGAIVIAVYWLAHRRFMTMIVTVDAPVTVINLVVLTLVALVPAATRLVDTRISRPEVMLIYAGLVIAIGAALAVFWGYAALVAGLVSTEVSPRVRWFLLLLIVFTPASFLVLTQALPSPPPPGAVPLTLVALFLIGWRIRLWALRRLAGTPTNVA
jgi:uncharacterized membrane protein